MDITGKSTLAKLLAAENISVEHQKVPTAHFDLKSRKIVLPIWKSMDNDLYDLLIGHEVGHALFTPLEGWHDQVTNKSQGFKSFLNVIEDARIERKIKEKFPGLVKNFYKGYQKLFAEDFFGVADKDVATLPLIDRINLHYKIGNMLGVTFSDAEQDYITRIDAAKTWQDVELIANDLYAYSEDETEMQDMFDDLQSSEYDPDDMTEGEEDDMAPSEGDNDGETEESEDASEGSSSGDSDEDEEQDSTPTDDAGSNSTDSDEKQEPKSFTDEAFRSNESRLLNEQAGNIVYGAFPKINLKKVILDIKNTWDTDFEGVFRVSGTSDEFATTEVADRMYSDFNRKNTTYINSLVQQFEMRRTATEFAKARQNKTGKLNVDKLWATKLTEDVFLSNTVVPNGKNHGMLMFVDFSGSMYQNMASTIEQLLIQISFCKKVNIPFDVYSFTNSGNSQINQEDYDIGIGMLNNGLTDGKIVIKDDDFQMLHLISSSLGATQYKTVFRKLLTFAAAFKNHNNGIYAMRSQLPRHLQMGATPLAECVLVARDLIKEFRLQHNVEIMNTIFLTDGDATGNLAIVGSPGPLRNVEKLVITEGSISTVVITNPTFQPRSPDLWFRGLLKHLKATVDTNLINFHIGNFKKRDLQNYLYVSQSTEDFDTKYKKEWTANKFFEIENFKQFDVFYAIQDGDNLAVDENEFEVKSQAKGDLLRGFRKYQNKKSTSKVFLNRFIDKVA